MSNNKTIMHVDMNAFFASVEQQVNPSLRNKPVAVIGAHKRTVITTASYEARAYGVKVGMTVPEAKKLCPDIIFVAGDNKRYTDTCTRLVRLYTNYTPLVEVYSVDEAFLDITGSLCLFNSPEDIAIQIKRKIRKNFGLTCSIGIGSNKLLAKLASNMKKPDGLTIIHPEDVSEILGKLPVSTLCGIGSRLEMHLEAVGVKTCGELGRFPVKELKRKFGIIGERLHQMGLGIDESHVVPVEDVPDAKSVGHSMTLDKDISDNESIERYILQLSEMVGRRLRRGQYSGRTVALTLRYSDFHTFTKRRTIKEYINDDFDIYLVALDVLRLIRLKYAVRLLGVSISNLVKDYDQMLLFKKDRDRQSVVQAMDEINDRYGEFSITRARLLDRYPHKGVIAPAWRPAGVRRVNYQ
ncbi:MAG: DNA polymerase IV [Candidatus Scalinduaceae bacterium]